MNLQEYIDKYPEAKLRFEYNINIKSKEFSTQINLLIELTSEQFEVLKTKLLRNILVL